MITFNHQNILFMKNYFVLLLMLLLPSMILGQSIFEKYQNHKEVTAINISPKMFQLLGSMSLSTGDSEADDLLEVIQGIRLFKALITGSSAINDEVEKWVMTEAEVKELDLMVSVRESDTDLRVYVKEGEKEGELKSLLMFSKGISNAVSEAQLNGRNIEGVVLLIEGAIAVDKISKLITKMNLPGGDQLKKAGL
jgi:hypothetical protein